MVKVGDFVEVSANAGKSWGFDCSIEDRAELVDAMRSVLTSRTRNVRFRIVRVARFVDGIGQSEVILD